MKHLLLLCLLLSGLRVSWAQPSGSPGRVTGTVLHAATRQPVEFATVALREAATDKVTQGTTCDEKGQFALPNVAPGTYKVVVSFVGFETKEVPAVRVAAGVVGLGTVLLSPAAQQLKEVTVTGQQELVQTRPDGLIYNAEKDITNTGGTAAELLRKVPLLNVDPAGNLELRGTTSVRVLINGKPSSILAASVADALLRLPASQIKAVEVITSPSAKYDAEGSGGVVNIILKKSDLGGFTGSVEASAGTRNSNLSTHLSQRRGKLGLNADLGTFAHYNRNRSHLTRTDVLPDATLAGLNQTNARRNQGGGAYGRLALDYDLSPKAVLTLGGGGSLYHYRGQRLLTSTYAAPGAAPDQFRRAIRWPFADNSFPDLDLNAGYTYTGRPRQEFSLLALRSTGRAASVYELDQVRPEGPDYRETSFNEGRNRETTLQTDYAHPLDSASTLELGAKAILRRAGSNYQIRADSLDGRGLVLVPARSNVFRYDQNVYAGYLAYGLTSRAGYGLKAGARLERTWVDGDFSTSDTKVRQDYTNFIPNLLLSRVFGPDRQQRLQLSYARRIQRPAIYFLNPYLNASNRRYLFAGNPDLRPELTDAYELGYNTAFKTTTLNFSAYWRQTNNAIQQVATTVPTRQLLPDDTTNTTTVFTSFRNVARSATYGLSVFGSARPTPKSSLSGTLNGYYLNVKSLGLNTGNAGWMYNANVSAGYELAHGLSLRAAADYTSARVLLQGRTLGYQSHSLAVKKELFDKKGSLTLGLENPLTRIIRYGSLLAQEGQFVARDITHAYNRSIRLSFNYQFGSLTPSAERARRKIQNDDQKKGE